MFYVSCLQDVVQERESATSKARAQIASSLNLKLFASKQNYKNIMFLQNECSESKR